MLKYKYLKLNSIQYTELAFGCLILVFLYVISFYNYLLFHAFAEIFSIAVGFAVVMIAWNTRTFIKNNYLLFLSIAYFFIINFDLLHTLFYKGMGIFSINSDEVIQLWIVARYIQSISFLIAPFLFNRKLNLFVIWSIYSIFSILFLLSIFYWNIFPACFIEETGLTWFKKISEYIVSLFMVGAIAGLLKKRRHFDLIILNLLALSILFSIISELAFTFYTDSDGLANITGYFFKIISVFFIYKAIIEIGLSQPYKFMFRELKRREEALQLSEQNYREIFNATNEAIFVHDIKDGIILDVNQAACEMYGYTHKEILNLTAHDLCQGKYPYTQEEAVKWTIKAIQEGTQTVEWNAKRKNNELFWAEVTLKLTKIGGRDCVLAVVRDISEKKAMLEIIKQSEKKYRQLFEFAPMGLLLNDLSGLIHDCNQNILQILGYQKSEIKQINIIDIYYDSEDRVFFLQELMQKGFVKNFEVKFRKNNGDIFDASINSTLVNINDLDKNMILTILQDITYSKQMEKSLYYARDKAEAANQAKSEFISSMSHELRTPLNAVLGYSQILQSDKNLTIKQLDALNTIYRSGEHLLILINDILDLSKIEAGKIEIKFSEFYLRGFIVNIAAMIKFKAFEKQVDFIYCIDPDLPECVLGDEIRLRQVLINLLGNAVKFTNTGGHILFTVFFNKDKIRFQVEDTGIGIKETKLNKIFLPFSQESCERFQTKGTGLGLTLCQRLIHMMDSELYVESSLEYGTRFWFDLKMPQTLWKNSFDFFEKPCNTGHMDDKSAGYYVSKNTVKKDSFPMNKPFCIPPADTMNLFYNLAMKGDINRIEKQAKKLMTHNSEYKAFGEKIYKLAQEFMMDELQEFIKQNMDKGSHENQQRKLAEKHR